MVIDLLTCTFQTHNSEQSSGPQAMRKLSSGLHDRKETPYECPSNVNLCFKVKVSLKKKEGKGQEKIRVSQSE